MLKPQREEHHEEEHDLEPIEPEMPDVGGDRRQGEKESADEERTGDPVDFVERESGKHEGYEDDGGGVVRKVKRAVNRGKCHAAQAGKVTRAGCALRVRPSTRHLRSSLRCLPTVRALCHFRILGCSIEVVRGVQSMGYVDPTPIQLRAFPIILAGNDMMGSAQTGTGKTAAFALPILSKLQARAGTTRALILEPTRELAAQVETAFRDYARFMDVQIGLVHGGVGFGKQREQLQAGVDVLVATPGRLLDFLGDGTANLKDIQYLVLDEVDRMLDMGFLPQVRKIVDRVPKQRQTLFFSATLPPELETMTQWLLKDPESVEIGARRIAGGDGDARALSGGQGPEIRPAHRAAREDRVR